MINYFFTGDIDIMNSEVIFQDGKSMTVSEAIDKKEMEYNSEKPSQLSSKNPCKFVLTMKETAEEYKNRVKEKYGTEI